jgi:hypothetical protein
VSFQPRLRTCLRPSFHRVFRDSFQNGYEISGLTLMPFGNSELESQRDSIVQPRVATEELPWVNAATMTYPNGVASSHRFPANLNFRKALGLTPLFLFHYETIDVFVNALVNCKLRSCLHGRWFGVDNGSAVVGLYTCEVVVVAASRKRMTMAVRGGRSKPPAPQKNAAHRF